MRRRLVVLGVVSAIGFAGFAVMTLVEHGSTCNPAYRHCPVEAAQLSRFMGNWCNVPSVTNEGPVREIFVQGTGRIEKTRMDLTSGRSISAQVRFVNDTGRILYRAYDQQGRPASPYIAVAMNGPDGRVSELQGQRSGFVRCETMAAAGVPEQIRVLYQ
jgi:hypothetical protein